MPSYAIGGSCVVPEPTAELPDLHPSFGQSLRRASSAPDSERQTPRKAEVIHTNVPRDVPNLVHQPVD